MSELIDNLTRQEYLEEKFGLSKFSQEDKLKLGSIDENLLDTIQSHRGFETFNPKFLPSSDPNAVNISSYYLYTGRGPSQGTLHIGHLLGLELILSLSKLFGSKIFFMIADDEKMLRDLIDTETMESNVTNTLKQLNAIGFDSSNTVFHINSKDISPTEYQMMLKLMSLVTVEQLTNIFGKKDNIGEYFYVFYQLVPCFLNKNLQCVVVAGVDQDPFFRLGRFLARKIGYKPPIVLYTKNVPGLDGSEKMSTSNPMSNPIFLSDSVETIKQKIFSIKKVGAGTLDELFEKGADLNSDTLIDLARLFEKDREILQIIEQGYSIGFNDLSEPELNKIKNISIPDKGFVTRNGKTMITTFGIRNYLLGLIVKTCYKFI
jgi:tryptophanyl-tRNA synthetase